MLDYVGFVSPLAMKGSEIRERQVYRVLSIVGLLVVDCLRRWPDPCIWPEDSRGPERECRSGERPNRRAETCSGFDSYRTSDFHRDELVRTQEKRAPLKTNPELAGAAQAFAEYLAHTDKFSHTADGKEPWDRTTKAGYQNLYHPGKHRVRIQFGWIHRRGAVRQILCAAGRIRRDTAKTCSTLMCRTSVLGLL